MRLYVLALIGAVALTTGCLRVPAGLSEYVSPNGCTPEGVCPYGGNGPANYYYSPTRTIVLAPGQGDFQLWHERCHAHQHQTILDAQLPSTIDLHKWYLTSEAQAFMAATGWQCQGVSACVNPAPSPWGYVSTWNLIEDAANTCAAAILWPDKLASDSSERAQWASEWLR